MSAAESPIQGVYVAAVTPHRREGHEADLGAMLELVDFLSAAHVDGIALMGSTGEFLHLTFPDRIRLVHLAVKRSRVPILVGVAHSTLDGAVELAREGVAAGAAGLLLMPLYFFRYQQEEIREFYREFANELGSAARILLYNIPIFTNPIAIETAVDLLSSGLFAGIKDSSGDYEYFARLLALRGQKPFSLLVGSDRIFTRARQAGAGGIISGVACAVPELLVALDRAIRSGHTAQVDRLDAHLQEFLNWLEKFPTPVGVKMAAAERGLKIGPLATPLSPASSRLLDEFREWFRAWLPSVQKDAESVLQ
ncbi:MAG: dihydrodipicolinate synthase family protein [Candidatus Solibacter usitatus]|nr:dihydrodipicolinate synthase family protein [Candidatus Solibacter usitatus]